MGTINGDWEMIEKYAKAVELYATTNLSIREIARITGFTPDAISAHIRRHHRELTIRRYLPPATLATPAKDSGTTKESTPTTPPNEFPKSEKPLQTSLHAESGTTEEPLQTLLQESQISENTHKLVDKIKSPKGQSLLTKLKYKDAIAACADAEFIEFNVSEIARTFNLDPTALASQLKYHFPQILENRYKIRSQLGLAHNRHRGARQESIETYSHALTLYRDTDLTLVQVAERCNVSSGGFGQYLRFYHKDLITAKAKRRASLHSQNPTPSPTSTSTSNPTSSLTQTSTPTSIHTSTPSTSPKPATARNTAAAEKYAPAIESLRKDPRPIAKVAMEYGLNADVFRIYLKRNHPDLHQPHSMTTDTNLTPPKTSVTNSMTADTDIENGTDATKQLSSTRSHKCSTDNKYKAAIDEYLSSSEPMKDIATRHGLVYKSLMSYLKRHNITR